MYFPVGFKYRLGMGPGRACKGRVTQCRVQRAITGCFQRQAALGDPLGLPLGVRAAVTQPFAPSETCSLRNMPQFAPTSPSLHLSQPIAHCRRLRHAQMATRRHQLLLGGALFAGQAAQAAPPVLASHNQASAGPGGCAKAGEQCFQRRGGVQGRARGPACSWLAG